MSATFEGQTFATQADFAVAFPAYRSYRGRVFRERIASIAELERAIAAGKAKGHAAAIATARRTGITTYSAAAPSRRTR